MTRSQLEHIIRAASAISGDREIVVIGSQAVLAQDMPLPALAQMSMEADVYPLNAPERADDIDGAIGELSRFHETYGYYAQGVSPETAVLPPGWQGRFVRLANDNTAGATGLCLDLHDLVLSKYVAGREKDLSFNRALIVHGCVNKDILLSRLETMTIEPELVVLIEGRIKSAFAERTA